MSDEFIKAPWDGKEVDLLNRYQRLGYVHEFTCKQAHEGLDRTLYATTNGWRCPHCDYQQDWAHAAMLRTQPIEKLFKLPCDVLLPPATIVRKGCELGTLMAAFKARASLAPSQNRFEGPFVQRPEDWTDF